MVIGFKKKSLESDIFFLYYTELESLISAIVNIISSVNSPANAQSFEQLKTLLGVGK